MVLPKAGPVDALLDRLLDSATTLATVEQHDVDLTALQKRSSSASPSAALATLYEKLSTHAWEADRHRDALRLILASSRVARHVNNEQAYQAAIATLAERHRVSGGFVAAELWNRAMLELPLRSDNAWLHAHASRELAAICEVDSRYVQGIAHCDRAISVCVEFADQPGIGILHIKALLEKAVIERLSGRLIDAQSTAADAQRLAQEYDAGPMTQGIVWLRIGSNELVLGRYDVALDAYMKAESCFTGVNDHNLYTVQLRQVACLRALNRLDEALQLTDALVTRFGQLTDNGYRLGQVLLERAEVLQDKGDMDAVRRTLEAAKPFYQNSNRLEALRWYRHMARSLIRAGNMALAATYLGKVLQFASQPDRRDLTRTMLALYDLTRTWLSPGLSLPLWLAVCRAAVVAADLQRDALEQPHTRWAMHAQREEIYFGSMGVHVEFDRAEDAAQIAEAGRADVLNQLLAVGPGGWSGTIVDQTIRMPSSHDQLIDGVFGVAQLAASAIRTGREPDEIVLLPIPGQLPEVKVIDALADWVVFINVGNNGEEWRSHVISRRRGGQWKATIGHLAPSLGEMMKRLYAGDQLPQRGFTVRQWEALGEFLLPDPSLWAGTPEEPQSIAIFPDPRLWQVPLAAIMRNGRYFGDVAEMVVMPSLRTMELLYQGHREHIAALQSKVAVSLLDSTLPGYAVEMDALDSWPGGHRQLADLDELKLYKDVALLYVSGHGEQPGATPLLGTDKLALDKLAEHALPPLVVLNGCWSGTPVSRYGQDPLSLAVGALLGGAHNVIAGTGEIGSEASARVAAITLDGLREGIPLRTALRLAQRNLRKEYPELGPSDWAGLYAVGVDS